MECEFAQGWATHGAGIAHHSPEIEALAGGSKNGVAGNGIMQGLAGMGAAYPLSAGIIFQLSQ